MAQFIMPPTGAGLTMDPYAGARMRNDALMNTTQNLGSSLGTLLQAVEQQRQQNYNKRLIESVLGGGDLNTALKTAQGGTPRTGLAGILDAFNPNVAPTGTPDMMKSVAEAKLKTLFKTPKEVLEEQKIQAEIENLGAKTKKLGEPKEDKSSGYSKGATNSVITSIDKMVKEGKIKDMADLAGFISDSKELFAQRQVDPSAIRQYGRKIMEARGKIKPAPAAAQAPAQTGGITITQRTVQPAAQQSQITVGTKAFNPTTKQTIVFTGTGWKPI